MNKRNFLKTLAAVGGLITVHQSLPAKELEQNKSFKSNKNKFNGSDRVYFYVEDNNGKCIAAVSFLSRYLEKPRYDIIAKAIERLYSELHFNINISPKDWFTNRFEIGKRLLGEFNYRVKVQLITKNSEIDLS